MICSYETSFKKAKEPRMADLMLLAVVIGLLGAWMSGRAAIYELLC